MIFYTSSSKDDKESVKKMVLRVIRKNSLIIFLLLSLAGCNFSKTNITLTAIPTIPTKTASTPTEQKSSPTPLTVSEITPNPAYGRIQAENASNLAIGKSFQASEPVRLKWSLDQKSFVLIAYQTFWVYSYPQMQLLYTSDFQPEEMLIDFSPNGEQYAVTFNQSSLLIKNWRENSIHTIQTDFSFMYGEFSPDGSQIILDRQDTRAGEIYDVTSGEKKSSVTGFETAAPVYSVGFGADGKHTIWKARATIQVSEIATNTLGTAIFHEDFLTSYALSPDGKKLATSTSQMEEDTPVPQVFFYQPMTGETLGTFELSIPAYSMDFSPDSSLLSVIDGTDMVILDCGQMIEVARFAQDVDSVNQILFSPDGTLITTIGTDQLVRFWQVIP